MHNQTLKSTAPTREVLAASFETGAFLKQAGADFLRAERRGSRVVLIFAADAETVSDLDRFNAGRHVEGDLTAFCDALRWAKSQIFEARRANDMERDFVSVSR